VATSLWVGGDTWGPIIVYWINPVAMTLAVLATFLLVRLVAGSFWALCGAVVFATSPVTVGLTTNPNSHATAVCCATWGMYLLLRWWQAHGVWRALLAGLLLGYAATIRYTEGLLVLPLVLVVLLGMRWRVRRAYLEAFWAIAGWAIPIFVLVSYNLAAMGHVTGYDGTNESIGFSWQFAADNWEPMLRQLGTIALYCIFPFSVIGLLAMLGRNWRVGLVLAAWAVPCILVYTFYYWAPDPLAMQQGNFIGYMRFFLTILPALVMMAFWLFDQIGQFLSQKSTAGAWASPWAFRIAQLSFGIVTLIAIAVHLQTSTFAAEVDQNNRLMLQTNTQQVLATAPAGSVIFAQDNPLLHHLQFERDYTLYTGETFNKGFIDQLPQMDPDEPQGWEPGRRDALYKRLKDLSQAQLDEDQRRLMTMALDAGRRVFFIIPRRDNDPPPLRARRLNQADVREFRRMFPGGEMIRRFATPDRFELNLVAAWQTPIVRPTLPDATKVRRRRVEVRMDRRQTFWQIVEVTKKPYEPPPPPAKPAPVKKPQTTKPSARNSQPQQAPSSAPTTNPTR
jgi:hypothetical protein